jgi:hypothetical protein
VDTYTSAAGGCVIGFDIEWRPNFRAGSKINRTALLQVAAERSVLCCQLSHMQSVPVKLRALLEDPAHVKTGVGILDDCVKYGVDWGVDVRGRVDLSDVYKATKGLEQDVGQAFGIKRLCAALLGVEIDKPKKVSMSNWERAPLDRRQIEYAALDAWAGRAIYESIRCLHGADAILAAARRDNSPAEDKEEEVQRRKVRKRAKLKRDREREAASRVPGCSAASGSVDTQLGTGFKVALADDCNARPSIVDCSGKRRRISPPVENICTVTIGSVSKVQRANMLSKNTQSQIKAKKKKPWKKKRKSAVTVIQC